MNKINGMTASLFGGLIGLITGILWLAVIVFGIFTILTWSGLVFLLPQFTDVASPYWTYSAYGSYGIFIFFGLVLAIILGGWLNMFVHSYKIQKETLEVLKQMNKVSI